MGHRADRNETLERGFESGAEGLSYLTLTLGPAPSMNQN